MATDEASRKREARMRTPDGIRSLPVDLKQQLATETAEFGYENEWRCLLFAAGLGLRVMQKMRDRSVQIVDNLEHL